MKARYTVVDGEVIAQKRNGVRTGLVPDMLGSTVVCVNMAQEMTDSISYHAYGELLERSGGTVTPFQFVGTRGYYQDAPGRSYVRARYLDSGTGRWVTQDPVEHVNGLNLYEYSYLRPTKYVDPSGLQPNPLLDKDVWESGLDVGFSAVGSAFSFGYWDGGAAKCDPSFDTSRFLASISRDSLLQIVGAGAGRWLSATGRPLAGLLAWYNKGSEADAAWRNLSAWQKVMDEVGKLSLSNKSWATVESLPSLERGAKIASGACRWTPLDVFRAFTPTMISSGPTPPFRFFAPYVYAAVPAVFEYYEPIAKKYFDRF